MNFNLKNEGSKVNNGPSNKFTDSRLGCKYLQGSHPGFFRYRVLIVYLCFLTCLIVTAGCNETFEPLNKEGTARFSMQGYVDAAADTQWLRIIPSRELLVQQPFKPEMEVTLENLETGDRVVMNDSLFEGERDSYFVNVWTEMDVEPGQTYRLTAEQSDGATSTVTVTTPPDFPMPIFRQPGNRCNSGITIPEVERLADVKSVWKIRFYFAGQPDERYYAIPYRNKAFKLRDGGFSVQIYTVDELNQIMGGLTSPPDSFKVLKRDIFIASGGPEWNEDLSSLDELIYFLPGQFSNVENGVGYVIGIVSKTIPLDDCF